MQLLMFKLPGTYRYWYRVEKSLQNTQISHLRKTIAELKMRQLWWQERCLETLNRVFLLTTLAGTERLPQPWFALHYQSYLPPLNFPQPS